jgi:hypothetical protein
VTSGVMQVCQFVKRLLGAVDTLKDGLVDMRLLKTRLGYSNSCWCLRTPNDILANFL